MIAKLRLGQRQPQPQRARPAARVRCEKDNWAFDPRYTNGKCPICGWRPEGVAAVPRWLAVVNRADWELVGLFALVDVLFLLGMIVAHAAGLVTGHGTVGFPSSSHPGGGVASGARLP